MTAKRRLLPKSEIVDTLALLQAQGIDLSQRIIDIGPNYMRFSPPANSNAGDDLANYINRPSHSQKADKER